MSFFRRIFGLPGRTQKRKQNQENSGEAANWLIKQGRHVRMVSLGSEHTELQLSDIRHVLNRVIQELEVLKEILEVKVRWDKTLYKQQLMQRMIQDHSMAGPTPWEFHSAFAYTLNEEEFLRKKLNASILEVADFKAEVERVSSQVT